MSLTVGRVEGILALNTAQAQRNLIAFSKQWDAVAAKTSRPMGVGGTAKGTAGIGAAAVGASGKVANLSKRMSDLGSQMIRLGSTGQMIGMRLTTSLTMPIALAGGAAIKVAYDFDKAMRRVYAAANTTGQGTAASFEVMRQAALSASQVTVFSASETADALYELVSAGWSASGAAKMLVPALKFAEAANLDVGKAINFASSQMHLWSKEISPSTNQVYDLGRIMDVTAVAVQKSQAHFADFTHNVLMSGKYAQDAGLSFEELAASIMAASDRGLPLARIGFQIRQSMDQMMAPSDKASKMMKLLGITYYTAQGKMKPWPKILEMLRTKLNKLNPQMKNLASKTLFNVRAGAFMRTMLGMTNKEFAVYLKNASNAEGAMLRMAKTTEERVSAQLQIMKNRLVAAGIAIGDKLLPRIISLIGKITELTRSFNKLDESTQNAWINVALLVAVLGPAIKIGSAVGTVFGFLWKILAGLGTALSFILGPLTGASAAFAGTIAIVLAVAAAVVWLVASFKPLVAWANSGSESMRLLKMAALTILNPFAGLYTAITNLAAVDISRVLAEFANLPNTIAYWMGAAVATVITWHLRLGKAAAYGILGLLAVIWGGVKQIPGLLGSAYRWSWEVAKSAWQTIISVNWAALLQMLHDIQTAFNSIPGRIWDALSGLAGMLWDVASNMGKSFVDGFTSYLQISSPSRVFVIIGQQIMDGLLKKMSPAAVGKRVKELFSAMKEAYEESRQELAGWKSMIDPMGDMEAYGKADLKYILKGQINILKSFQKSLMKLSGRIPKEMWLQLAGLGPDAALTIANIAKMSKRELAYYVKLWKSKEGLLDKLAITQTAGEFAPQVLAAMKGAGGKYFAAAYGLADRFWKGFKQGLGVSDIAKTVATSMSSAGTGASAAAGKAGSDLAGKFKGGFDGGIIKNPIKPPKVKPAIQPGGLTKKDKAYLSRWIKTIEAYRPGIWPKIKFEGKGAPFKQKDLQAYADRLDPIKFKYEGSPVMKPPDLTTYGIIWSPPNIEESGVTHFVNSVIAEFQRLYDVLFGNSIVPDLINGIVGLFNSLPGRIIGQLTGLSEINFAGLFEAWAVLEGQLLARVVKLQNRMVTWFRWVAVKAGMGFKAGTSFVMTSWNLMVKMLETGAFTLQDRIFIWGARVMQRFAAGLSSRVGAITAVINRVIRLMERLNVLLGPITGGSMGAGAGSGKSGTPIMDRPRAGEPVSDALKGLTPKVFETLLKVAEFISGAKGKPYVWGADGPAGFDCSGFVSAALRAGGLMGGRLTSSTFPSMGAGGRGLMRVLGYQGNPGHVWMQILGREFESSTGGVHKNSVARGGAKYNFPVLDEDTRVKKAGVARVSPGDVYFKDGGSASISIQNLNVNVPSGRAGQFIDELQKIGLRASQRRHV